MHFVRKRLVVQLLAVGFQIYNEAARYFWSHNTWRFTDDQGWEILLRFMLTIGPNARALILELEALAPSVDKFSHVLPGDKHWVIKNEPKLHIAKLFHDDDRHGVVWELWMRESSLRMLSLIIPAGYEHRSLCRHFCGCCYWDEHLMGFLAKTQFIAESGGAVYDIQGILQQG